MVVVSRKLYLLWLLDITEIMGAQHRRFVRSNPGFLSTGLVLTSPRFGDPDQRSPNSGLPDTESVPLNPG
jgi:hypothetical protein